MVRVQARRSSQNFARLAHLVRPDAVSESGSVLD